MHAVNQITDREIMDYEEALMSKAAWYYYYDELTQQQIAEKLGVTRVRVIRLLDKAKKTGVVRFQIRSGSEKRLLTEQKLVSLFGLEDCFVVPAAASPEDTNENIARAASMYIGSRIPEEAFINVGYGDTSGRILNHLAIRAERALSCVSLTGGVSYYLPNANSSVFNSRLYLIPTPLIASTDEMAEAMRTEKSVKDVERLIPLSFMTVVGIGSMGPEATILTSGILSQNDFLVLQRNGAVGDILSHFIDQDGNIVASDLEKRIISTPLETLRSLKNVIGVAAGLNKVTAILATLRGRYIDTLITDEDTALTLAKAAEE